MYNQTPLSYAAQEGCEGAVKILLTREEVNPNKADYCGRTLPSYATRYEHESAVVLLRSRKAIIPCYNLSPETHHLVEIKPVLSLSGITMLYIAIARISPSQMGRNYQMVYRTYGYVVMRIHSTIGKEFKFSTRSVSMLIDVHIELSYRLSSEWAAKVRMRHTET